MTKEQEKLVTANMGYVVTLARQYRSDILNTNDLVNEGAIGLMKAAEKYDPERGKPFVTFAAPYIRRSIEAAINKVSTDTDVRSTDESLPVGSRNNYTLLNVLEDVNAEKADAIVEEDSLNDDLLACVDILTEREHEVVSRYYGLKGWRQTMAEIAEDMGLKRERVRQERDKAVRKLRKEAKSKMDDGRGKM
ncbi:MAG: sigma-70 family RNA polymerase sigma factor [Prevotella sp.]|nr:sigma-70 family RNA polymerase sigma factor [Prevotella sp.]